MVLPSGDRAAKAGVEKMALAVIAVWHSVNVAKQK